MTPPELSIVLALGDGSPSAEAVASLSRACRDILVELIVAVAGRPPERAALEASFPGARLECRPAGTLIPILWGAGLNVATGRHVAFTTDQLRVAPTWARTLLSALASGAVGAGGPIDLGPDSDAATAAAYFIRFSAFAPHLWPAPALARDVAGDNSAYRREALLRHADLLVEGFWEVEFHRRFERDGNTLRMEPAAAARMVGPVPFGPMLRRRYRHAKEFGRSRVERHGERKLKLLLSAPLVPIRLIFRMAARVLPVAVERRLFFGALPRLALLSAAWAAGEAMGAIRARERGSG